jgi:hypothetical protein
MDGKFGLVRKLNSGADVGDEIVVGNGFFLKTQEVHEFVLNYGDDSQRDKVNAVLKQEE